MFRALFFEAWQLKISAELADRRGVRGAQFRVVVDLAMLPGPPGFFGGAWVQVHGGNITGADAAARPCKFTSFLVTALAGWS